MSHSDVLRHQPVADVGDGKPMHVVKESKENPEPFYQLRD